MESCDQVWNYTLFPEGASEDLYSAFDKVALTIIMPIFLSVGVAGNLAFFVMLYRVKKMRSLTNFYLANLAVADIVFLVFAICAKINEYRLSSVNFAPVYHGTFSCLVKHFVSDLAYFASLFMITLVSFERYYAICKPMRHRTTNTWERTIKLTIVAWSVSFIFALSTVPSYSVVGTLCIVWPAEELYAMLPGQYSYCAAVALWAADYSNTLQTVPFFLAFFLNTAVYTRIILRLTQRVGHDLGQVNVAQGFDPAARTRNHVARMLVINGTIFFLLLAPFEVVSILISTSTLTYTQRLVALQICRLLSYLNSAINPFIFVLLSSRYRQSFREAFLPGRRNRVNPEQVPSVALEHQNRTTQNKAEGRPSSLSSAAD